MALPSLIKSYNFLVNQQVTGGVTSDFTMSQARATMLLNMKNQLVSWGHVTVKRSSNGITAADSDLLTTIGDFVTNQQNPPGSWMVLDFTATGFELLLSQISPVTFTGWDGEAMTMQMAPKAFGGFSGGSQNANPTAQNAITIHKNGVANWGASANTDPTFVWHMHQSTDGKHTRVIFTEARHSC
jgi:hypothetical protein